MKKTYLMVAMLSLATLALGPTERSFARNKPSGQIEPSKRRVLIGFKDGIGHQAAERRKGWVREIGGEVRYSYRFVPAAAANLSETQISRFRADPRVTYIEEDGLVHALDLELDNSWGVKHIGAGNVHSYNKGAGVKVAIIDTGIDYTHPDLDGNYAGGYDFVNSDNNPMDDNGHGTHCAGIAAAEDNNEGVVGVAPEASIYGVKVLSSSGSGYLSDVVAGIQWAIDNGMDIISMSLGTNYNYQTLQNACDQAYAAGILLVAAAGNDYSIRLGIEQDTVDYPARYGSVIAVGATDNTDTKASFSSTGLTLELAAPGVNIKSTYRGGGYASGSGTSMACPHVAGTAALVLAGPGGDVRAILQNTADELGNPGRDKWYGFGLVDADEAAGAPAGPPSAEFMGAPLSGDKPLTVQFMDISTGNITSWSWDFGDGGTSTQRDPSHEYQDAGSYTVSLTATGPGGSDTETKTNYIAVTAPLPPTAAFSGSPTSGEAPLAVQFTDNSTGSISGWSWTFGDGGGSTEQNPSHEYQNVGSYTVSLTVTGLGGSDTETKTNYIDVISPAQIEVFFDSFESYYDWTANWSQDSQNDWRRRTARSVEGNYAVEVDGFASNSQLISAPIDLHGKQNATITFWWYIESGLDAGEYLAFDVSTNGSWLEKARLRGNVDTEEAWHNVNIDLTSINNIRIRFRATMSGSTEDAYVDVVRVIAW